MAPRVLRQRKHKNTQRSGQNKNLEAGGDDTNILELTSISAKQKVEKENQLQIASRAEVPKISSKKQKRLDRYIDKKLRKEENLELIRKLESAKVDTKLLRSSRDLGVKKGSRGRQLKEASPERSDTYRGSKTNEIIPPNPSSANGEHPEVSDDSLESTTAHPAELQQPTTVAFGSGLKRGLDTNLEGQPLLKRRKSVNKARNVLADGDDVSWEGFSSTGDENESIRSDASSVGTQTNSDLDITDSLTEGTEEDERSSNVDENDDSEGKRKQRSSAFKAWAMQQVNEALGFEPTIARTASSNEEQQKKSLTFTPRGIEQDPLPLELSTRSAAPERKAYTVRVQRPSVIQDARMQLPVVAEEQKIMEAIYNNPTVVIWGATGSGKTTQVPQFLYEAGFGSSGSSTAGMVGITQPRRVAAASMANRVSDELGGLNGKVSYQIRFESSVSDKTAIKFMTDGILIREIANDFALLKYSVIVIDEAHERSANTDILIGMVSRIVDLRATMHKEDSKVAPLKLIIMSATLRISDFIENPNLFRNGAPPLLQAEGRQFPVTVHFSRRTQRDYLDEAFLKVSRGHKKLPPGGMLVFLTGQNEISALAKRLREAFDSTPLSSSESGRVTIAANEAPLEAEDVDLGQNALTLDEQESDTDGLIVDDADAEFEIEDASSQAAASRIHVLPLYSQLQTKDQLRVFEPPPEGARLIILATNVAETSLTIPGIRYVFDCGRAKEKKYDQLTGVQSFEVGWISKASASQRAGRAGRTGPGHCYRLYSSAVYERDFAEHAEPEMLRMPVEGVVLQLKSMDLQHVVNFPFPTPPDRQSLAKAEKLLTYLGALSKDGKITSLGLELSTYPLSPRFSKMLAIGHQHGCMPYTIAMVSALTVPDMFIPENLLGLSTPSRDSNAIYSTNDRLDDASREQRRRDYNRARRLLSRNSPYSDAIKAMSAICAYAYVANQEDFAKEMFLSPKSLKEASHLRQQLSTIVRTSHLAKLPSKYESRLSEPSQKQLKALQQILAAAFVDQVAIRADAASSPPEVPRKPTRAIDVPYLPLFRSHQGRADDLVDIAVFIHPSSVLANCSPKDVPEYVVYSHLQRATPPTIDEAKKPRTRMHALCSVTGKQLAALAKGTPLLEYSKPIGKIVELSGGKRECWVIPELVGDKGGRRWPLPAQKVVQKREAKEGWVIEKVST